MEQECIQPLPTVGPPAQNELISEVALPAQIQSGFDRKLQVSGSLMWKRGLASISCRVDQLTPLVERWLLKRGPR